MDLLTLVSAELFDEWAITERAMEYAGPALLIYLECHHPLRHPTGLPPSTAKIQCLGLP
jgi:hypothetical protein